MLSDLSYGRLPHSWVHVLILVLMEYALWLKNQIKRVSTHLEES